MANAHRDDNRQAVQLAASNAGTGVPIELWADPTTHRLLVTTTLTGGSSIPVSGATTATVVAIVDGSGNQITSFGGGTQYTEGETDASITGTALMFEGAGNALVAATGDATNGLDVDVTRSALPSGASTSAKQDTAAAILTTIDTDTGNISTKIDTLAGAVSGTEMQVDVLTLPAITGTVTANAGTNLNTSALALESGGNLAAAAASLATLDNIVSGSEAQVDVVAALPAGDNNIGNMDIVSVPADPFGANADAASATGSISAKLRFIASTGIPITGTVTVGSHAVTNAGTFVVQENGAALTALQVMDDWDNGASDGASVSGDVAHDTADAGEPVKMGMKAVALKANPTEVAAGDRTNWYADVSGVPFVLGGHPNILTQNLQVTDADGAQTDAAIITAGANVAIVVTGYEVVADEANTGGVSCRIGFGTANTPAADAAQVLMFHPGIAPGSGVVRGDGSGILGIGASNEDLRVTCEDPAGGSISITVTYFTTDI